MLGGFAANPSNPWPELYLSNRMAMALNCAFAAAFSMIYQTTRNSAGEAQSRSGETTSELKPMTSNAPGNPGRHCCQKTCRGFPAAIWRLGGSRRGPSGEIILTRSGLAKIASRSPSAMSSAKAFPPPCSCPISRRSSGPSRRPPSLPHNSAKRPTKSSRQTSPPASSSPSSMR